MVRRFFASNDAFNGEFAQFLEQERGTGEDVANTVTGILKDVQARGGEAGGEGGGGDRGGGGFGGGGGEVGGG